MSVGTVSVLRGDGWEDVPLSEVPALLASLSAGGARPAWLHAEPDPKLLEDLEAFGIEEHVLGVLAQRARRPRVEEYEAHLAVSFAYLRPGTDDSLETTLLLVFLGPSWVISLGALSEEDREELATRVRDQVFDMDRRASAIVYLLAEWAVESFLPGLDRLNEQIDQLEDMVVLAARQETVEQLFHLKQEMVELRRQISPMREVMLRLADDRLAGRDRRGNGRVLPAEGLVVRWGGPTR